MSVISTILLVTKRLDFNPSGGRELLCKLNHDVLKAIYGERLFLFELPSERLHGVRAYANAFRGYIDGLNAGGIATALETIESKNISKVFVDGSNLGEFVAVLKRRHPQVEATVFFHNVEARFFWGSLRLQKSIRALAVLVANFLAERKAVRHSAKRVCLSERDSRLLKKLYLQGATHIAPMALGDKMPADFSQNAKPPSERFALFVGGTFYANRTGITWFVQQVVPRIQIKICIVGRGFEELRHELEVAGKVQVIGAVDHLADWYRDAQFVIAPIFDGSGMKTKVAEALMYGKKIIGTPEAFSGYEDIADQAGWVCSSADDFVAAIGRAKDADLVPFDPDLRSLYEAKYSFAAARSRLAEILES